MFYDVNRPYAIASCFGPTPPERSLLQPLFRRADMVQSAVMKTEDDVKAEVGPPRAKPAAGTSKQSAQTAYRQRQKVLLSPLPEVHCPPEVV